MRLGNATGAFLASALPRPCLCTKVPSVLEEGLGAGGLQLPRAPAVKALSEGSEGQQQGSFSGSLAAQTKLRTESTRFQGALDGFCIPTLPEADSVGA